MLATGRLPPATSRRRFGIVVMEVRIGRPFVKQGKTYERTLAWAVHEDVPS